MMSPIEEIGVLTEKMNQYAQELGVDVLGVAPI